MLWYNIVNSIICDIDGVILTCLNWQDMEDFYQNMDSCVPVDWAVHLINGLHQQGIKIIFLTARDSKCRSYTKFQLEQLFDFPINLYMRLHGDTRDDYIIKAEYIQEFIKNENILFCIDDNLQNCEMYKSFGLTALHVQ